ncbi:MAG TPA: crosslink repair DNA glycosylase YcaQ family protein, partial [Acetobacteraceae bacterium]|nr:crosslink repair DNA glycosylase YcaQ family protein [Acetobacteraceae bacterium]
MIPTVEHLRRQALNASLITPVTLGRAVASFGFVQADPIRSPARAQDLILRHRVKDYRLGELDRRFARLGLEEDYLYAYGFMPRTTLRLLQPRYDITRADGRHAPTGLAAEVFAFVRDRGKVHPRDLEKQFGTGRAQNAWGGFSQATTRALQHLHYYGLLRVARRRDGIRVYEVADHPDPLPPEERMRDLVRLVARILSPISKASLRTTFNLLKRGAPDLENMDEAVQQLLKSGELEQTQVDREVYFWPAQLGNRNPAELQPEVRFLAPFDPLVWDRRRFEHFWNWSYRFEGYTPAVRRQRGYYAMPMLWQDDVVGWINLTVENAGLKFTVGYATAIPQGREFRRAFDAEL